MPKTPLAVPDQEKIKALIWARGYDQAAFAKRIGRPAGTLYDVLSRQPPRISVTFARYVARGLEVRPGDFCDWTGDDDCWDGPLRPLPDGFEDSIPRRLSA